MTKDIYIIRNTVNDKCYVGQSVDYKYRFRKHKEEALRNNYKYKSALYNAMNKYGVDKFYVELLETNVEDYNEREIYWINKLNTLRPNGYNVASGGAWYPNLSGVDHNSATIKSMDALMEIYDDLMNTRKTLTEIAKEHGTRYGVIGDINAGRTYRIGNFEYPLREMVLSEEKLNRLTFDLKYSRYTYAELAKMYDLSFGQIKAINYGSAWHRDYLQYPIRKMAFGRKSNAKETQMIQCDLISTSDSFQDISKRYGCSVNTVIRINSGETHRDENLKYPLRNVRKISQCDLNKIYNALLYTNKSMIEIAKEFNTSDATIKRINSGETKSYRSDQFTYPLRPM